jgi:predicted O-methyltransferase YrrM
MLTGQTFNLEKALKIDGWMSDLELCWLASTASNCRLIMEIGSYYGRSTRVMLDNSQAIITCVDPMTGLYFDKDDKRVSYIKADALEQFLTNTADFRHRVVLFRCLSQSLVFTDKPSFDFVFVDGDHRYLSVMHDIKLAEWLVKSGGIIAGHDYDRDDWPGVTKAVHECYGDKFEKVDSIWWVQR